MVYAAGLRFPDRKSSMNLAGPDLSRCLVLVFRCCLLTTSVSVQGSLSLCGLTIPQQRGTRRHVMPPCGIGLSSASGAKGGATWHELGRRCPSPANTRMGWLPLPASHATTAPPSTLLRPQRDRQIRSDEGQPWERQDGRRPASFDKNPGGPQFHRDPTA